MKSSAIQTEFFASLSNYSHDKDMQRSMWREIEKNYTQSNRYYHTLNHLDSLLVELQPLRSNFSNWDTVIFTIVYHDVIYRVLKNNNEESSAELAVNRLKQVSFPEKEITRCGRMILATKKHEASDFETNLITDADLAILGAGKDAYVTYTRQIRQEYSIYPDLMYVPGRKKVLQHFMGMKAIYKTEEFSHYEQSARKNMQNELNSLSV